MSVAETIATYLLRVAATTIVQLLTLFGPGLVLIALLSKLAAYVTRLAYLAIGRYFYLLLFGWLGTTVHELGHAIFAMIFGHKIVRFHPFRPDPKAGTLGSVLIAHDTNSIYQQVGRFFVGIAPIVFGTSLIFAALLILFQTEMADLIQSVSSLSDTAESGAAALAFQTLAYCAAILRFLFMPEHLADWRFYLFLYLTFAIGSSIHLSDSDIRSASAGFGILIVLFLLFNLVTLWQGDFAAGAFELISRSYAFFYVILGLVLALNLLAALLLLVPALVLGRR